LKVFWTQEKDKWTWEKRTKIDKTNFLRIYAAAHVCALTPSNIKAAFEKTGVVPFNRSVVTPAMMAPSLETSCRGSLPIAPSTPIRAVTNLFRRAQKRARDVPAAAAADPEDTNGNSEAEELSPRTPQRRRPENPFSSPIREAIETLRTSSTSFIFSSSPIQAASDPPLFTPHAISPQNPKYAHLLAEMPMTVREHDLQEALREVSTANSSHKTQIITMQSSLVLNGAYVDSVRGQLEAQEEAKKNKQKKGRLVGDGLPRLLTSRSFTQQVRDHVAEVAQKANEVQARKVARRARANVMGEYKAAEAERVAKNKVLRAKWVVDVANWEHERDQAKLEKRRPGWSKPLLKDTLLPKIPIPTAADPDGAEGEGEGSSSDTDSDSEKSGSERDSVS